MSTVFGHNLRTCRELNLLWGVRSIYKKPEGSHFEDRAVSTIKYAVKKGLLKPQDHVIVISRSTLGKHLGSISSIFDVQRILDKY